MPSLIIQCYVLGNEAKPEYQPPKAHRPPGEWTNQHFVSKLGS